METIFVHSTTKSGRRFTVAAVQSDDQDKARIGLAICNPCDQFCKKIGRTIALGRAKKQPEEIVDTDMELKNIAYHYACVIQENWVYPYHSKN